MVDSRSTNSINKDEARRQVRFGEVEIWEFPIVIGDNPGCSSGAPIQIGWIPIGSMTQTVNFYEQRRGKRKRNLIIPVEKRGKILLHAGYSIYEIGNAAVHVDHIKKLRAESLQNQGWDNISVLLEMTGQLPRDLINGILETTGLIGTTFQTDSSQMQNYNRARSARSA